MSIDKNEIVVEMNDVNKWYGEFHVLKNVCLRVKKGEKSLCAARQGQANQR